MDSMEKAVKVPNRIAVTWHPNLEESKATSQEVVAALQSRMIDRAESFSLNDGKFRDMLHDGQFDLVIALGGDGTIFYAMQRPDLFSSACPLSARVEGVRQTVL